MTSLGSEILGYRRGSQDYQGSRFLIIIGIPIGFELATTSFFSTLESFVLTAIYTSGRITGGTGATGRVVFLVRW